LDWARQVWHDVNVYGSRPNAALSLSMDARDPINQMADQLEKEIPFYTGQVNKMKRQVKAGDGYFTLTTFRGGCVTLVKGISGIAFGMKPVPGLKPEELEVISQVAKRVFYRACR
jgi:DNA-sulfur modification-associated